MFAVKDDEELAAAECGREWELLVSLLPEAPRAWRGREGGSRCCVGVDEGPVGWRSVLCASRLRPPPPPPSLREKPDPSALGLIGGTKRFGPIEEREGETEGKRRGGHRE